MAGLTRKRSSGRQRLRQGYVGKNFNLENRQYIVEDVIAEGGFSVVLEVKCLTGNNEKLALKRIAVNNSQDLFLCRQEIAIIKALSDCPNSITYKASQINRIGRDVYEVLVLTQLYTASSVLTILRQHYAQGKSIPEKMILKIFCDVCLAVSRLHHRTKPITHRDLKIENVLQDFEGNFILCDYGSCTTDVMLPREMGVAQCEEQILRFTTLAYRAPEMIDFYSDQLISTKADIWALGCFLYKLCFFDTPFGEQTLAILRGTFSIPKSSQFSPDLHKLIRYILNPNPKERPDIFQVGHLAYQQLGESNPIINIHNAPIPSLPGTPPTTTSKPAEKKQEPTIVRRTQQLSPASTDTNATLKAQSSSPIISTSARARPRPRPTSSVGPPPSPIPSRPLSTTGDPGVISRVISNGSTSSNLTESTDSTNNLLSKPPSFSSISQPLPPSHSPLDPFGHTPFMDEQSADIFGSVPFTSTVTQTT